MTAAKALLWPQQDSGHGTTAAAARLWPWQNCVHGKMPWLWPNQDCGHDKTAAMARLQPWHYYCSHGKTVATARLQPQHYCGHGKTVAMASTLAHSYGIYVHIMHLHCPIQHRQTKLTIGCSTWPAGIGPSYGASPCHTSGLM